MSYLSTINLPKVTTVGHAAFDNCTALTTITLPEVVTVDDRAFYACAALTKADFGKVETLGEKTFYDDSALKTVILRNTETVCAIDSTAFNLCGDSFYIYVPAALLDSYTTTYSGSTYSYFNTKFRAIESYPSITG